MCKSHWLLTVTIKEHFITFKNSINEFKLTTYK